MIAPSRLLLFLFAALGLPAFTLGPLLPQYGTVLMAALGLLAVLAFFDAALARNRLDHLEVFFPEVIRLNKDRVSEVEARLVNKQDKSCLFEVGLNLPEAFEKQSEIRLVSMPGKEGSATILWTFLPRKRGRFRLESCHLRSLSPLKLWHHTASRPLKTEMRIYPNLRDNKKAMAPLLLRRFAGGSHVWRQVGQGREFEKLREYAIGDSFEDIHWKTTAKRRHPITKVYQIERTQSVYVLLDTSRLSGTPVRGQSSAASQPLIETCIQTALFTALSCEKQGDHCGLVLFDEKIQKFIRASGGANHYHLLRDMLFEAVPSFANPDYEELAACVRTRIRKRSLLILLTALDDQTSAELLINSLRLLSRQHLVLAGIIRPSSVHPVFAGSAVRSLDEVYRRLSGHLVWKNLQQWQQTLQHLGVQTLELHPEQMADQVLARYSEIKRRQLL